MSSVALRRLTRVWATSGQEAAPLVRSAFNRRIGGDRKGVKMTDMPEIVSAEKWQQDRDELLKAEKEATVSNMPLAQIEAYKARMGWTMPFVSSHGTTFADDCGAGGGFMLSVFLRDDEDVYRTYGTTARGVDRLLFVNNILDLTPYGRQEDWEDSPPGWPQHPTYG
jgi:predicted dithiol-disulfide oxidoreductase (DUF899 family)